MYYVIIDDEKMVVDFARSSISFLKGVPKENILDCHTLEGFKDVIRSIISRAQGDDVTFFIDHQMPKLDYRVCIQEIRKIRGISTTIVAMSGDLSKKGEMVANGADIFIEKVHIVCYLKAVQ
jgi:hypothetical protein